jgi:hypothetical protein
MAAAADGFGSGHAAPSAPNAPPNAVQIGAGAPPLPPPGETSAIPPPAGALSFEDRDVLPETDPRVPSTMPRVFTADDLRTVPFTALQSNLVQQSVSLAPIASVLAHDCDGL